MTIENQRADAESAPNLAVQARNFEGVESFQFEIQFDTDALSVGQAEDLIENAERSFQVAGPSDRGEGELFVAFFQGPNESSIDVSDGTLFEINFTEFTGGRGDVTFNVSNSEVNGGIGTTFQDGFVSDQGGAVTIGNASDVGLNRTASVPLTGSDGIGSAEVGQFEFTVEYDESNLQFEEVSSNQTGLSDGDLIVNEETGSVTIEGAELDNLSDPSIDLSGDFLELEFTFLGESSDLQFQSSSAVRNTEGNPIATNFSGGAVSGDSPTISIADQGVSVGEEVTVPVETDELQELGSADISISFTEASLTFERAENVIGENFSAGVTEPGTVEISGFDTEGANPAGNDSRLVDLVFTVESGVSSFGDEVALQFSDGSQVSNPAGEVYSTTFNGGRLVVENPAISFSRTSVDYGSVQTGDAASETVTITNEATEAATLEGDVSLTDGSDAAYSVTDGSGTYSLGPGESQDVTVEYAPSEVSNPDEGVLQVTSNDPENESQDVSLTGQAEPVQVALPAQSLDQREGDTKLRVEDVIANAGDAVVVTTDDGDGDFTDEEVVGSTTLEENVDGGEVLVDVGDADPVDHAAHVSTDGTVGGVVATSDRAPVYATAQFDWQGETSVGPAETVSVDAVEILYQGEVGRDTISVNLHEASGGEITGDFIGISQEDLAVNVVHEEVAIDVIEPISPPAESPQRTESTIAETGEFFAMAHLGPAGTGADGGRVPVGGSQQPPLRTTASPGVIGDFATVTVEAADLNVSVSRGFEGGASDPADYELVAIPGSTGVDVAETVTGDRGTNWRAFLETGGSGGDGSLQSYGDDDFSFRAGRGVWVLAQNGWSFEGTVPAVSAADGTPSVPLQDGWNAISNPLQEDLVWANVRDASGLSEALFRWTGDGGFQPVDTLRSAREDGEAYYTLNNEGADSLELTSGASSNSTLAANTASKSGSNVSPRTVELSATAGGKGMTSTVTVGMNPSAEEASSYRAPPAHFGGTALRIRDGDPVKSFMRMVAATDAETSRFDLSLQAEPGTSVEISAGDLPKNAGPGFGVVLVDGGDTHDLRDGPATVTVGENSESAGFQVQLGDAEKIAQQTAPDETRLKANYPNPFSEQTTIEYDVAEQSEVNIRVYNVLGQQVATLARGTKQAGTHQVDWSGQSLSSGKYFVRLEAGGTTDTKQVTIVR
ncbi:hypothetical protein GGQ13_003086 [Salinibacter ruber]|uniref:cohesin domain-containing protein n=1 Tax=Salinibacter ruber TaxID=146919 RepID=UPI00216816DA|nr:hypothetical protein [Salinibacter ruber]